MVGAELPVRPRKRYVYHFDCRERLGPAPLTIAPSGVYFRPEGESWIAGYSPREGEADPDTLDLEVDRSRFDDFVWPELARRVPAFESVRLLDAWAGHYEVNTLDHNAVIGPHPDLPGFLFANGFSGHGLQQAPAVGRGLAEWIATGRYETLDLSPLGYERIAAQPADSGAERRLITPSLVAGRIPRVRIGERQVLGAPIGRSLGVAGRCRSRSCRRARCVTAKRSRPRSAGPLNIFSPRMLYVLWWQRHW